MTYWEFLALVFGWIVALFVLGVAARVLWLIWMDRIDLKWLLSDDGGKASISRLQLLIFTLVIGLGLFLIIVYNKSFPASIPNEILGLLGISGASFVISKGIDRNKSATLVETEAKTVRRIDKT